MPPRKFCIPEDITKGGLNGAIIGWLKNEFKKDGDKALRFGASRNIIRALLETSPCKELDKNLDTPIEDDGY